MRSILCPHLLQDLGPNLGYVLLANSPSVRGFGHLDRILIFLPHVEQLQAACFANLIPVAKFLEDGCAIDMIHADERTSEKHDSATDSWDVLISNGADDDPPTPE